MNKTRFKAITISFFVLMTLFAGCKTEQQNKVPITTSSEKARDYYLKGRELLDKLKRKDAAEYFQKALELDPDFALAHLHYSIIAPNSQQIMEHLARAVELADKVSAGEKYKILGMEAFLTGQADEERDYYQKLVRDYPEDDRAQLLMGNHYFFQNDYNRALGYYRRAIEINPDLSIAYNQIGYTHRYLENYQEAEEAFKQYIKLVPKDPNPYDSYGDLLIKMGQFQESIKNYKMAVALDSNFASSYVGIASNLNLLGQYQEARQILKKGLSAVHGELQQRMLHYGIVISFLDEEDFDAALEQMTLLLEFDGQQRDTFHLAEDIGHVGDIYSRLEQFEKAREQYTEAFQLITSADIDSDLKGNTEISYFSRMVRIAIKKGELEKATELLAELESKISGLNDRNKTQVYYSLLGQLALKKNEYDRALGELRRANLHRPYVLWYMANAYEGKGDIAKAKEYYRAAAKHNSVGNFYYALIRKPALRKLESLQEPRNISQVLTVSFQPGP